MAVLDAVPREIGRRLGPLRARREAQVLMAYGGGAWLIYDVLDLTAFVLGLPDVVLRAAVAVLALGAVAAMAVARWYDRTARWLETWRGAPGADVPGVPDIVEPLLIWAGSAVKGRTAVAVTAGSTVGFAVGFMLLGSWWAEAHAREVEDDPVGVAVFPLASVGPEAERLGDAVAELLVVTLDGTRGVRVIDPAAMWRGLARGDDGAPELDDALDRARSAGAGWMVLGSVTRLGARVEASVRIYGTGAGEPLGSARAGAPADSLGTVIDRLAIETVARVWDRDGLPTVPEIDRLATADAAALKAWLDAKALFREGRVDDALDAVERATALDSTFALAHLDRFRLLSWSRFQNAQSYDGLSEVVRRAADHAERMAPRNRMRVDAALAQDRTDGSTAAFLLERILAMDPRDVDALESLAYTYLADGWQVGKGKDEIRAAYRRVLAVDPGSLVARTTLARLAAWDGRVQEALGHVDSIPAPDSASAWARGTAGAVRALADPDPGPLLRTLAGDDIPVVTTVLRDLRTTRPALAERFLRELQGDDRPVYHRQVGTGALAQLWMAESRLSAVDSMLALGELEGVRPVLEQMVLASTLAGTCDTARARRAAGALSDGFTPDSVAPRLARGVPAWSRAWALGAYQAAVGDTAAARRWQAALEELPADLFLWDGAGALSADVESRLAQRAGETEVALEAARRAAALWTLHGQNTLESEPDLAFRFHLAELYRASGQPERAEPWYRGLVPPHTWTGFYTAIAQLRLAESLEARGRDEEALSLYRSAAALWSRGDATRVGALLEAVREGERRIGSAPSL